MRGVVSSTVLVRRFQGSRGVVQTWGKSWGRIGRRTRDRGVGGVWSGGPPRSDVVRDAPSSEVESLRVRRASTTRVSEGGKVGSRTLRDPFEPVDGLYTLGEKDGSGRGVTKGGPDPQNFVVDSAEVRLDGGNDRG